MWNFQGNNERTKAVHPATKFLDSVCRLACVEKQWEYRAPPIPLLAVTRRLTDLS